MTTTAHEDQYTVAPEPVRQPYDTVSILKQNVADLELALRTQTERAEAAEAEMAKLAKQEPVAYVKYKATGGNVGLAWMAIPTAAFYPREGEKLYVTPVPAPHKGATHCDGCGLTWLDDGLNPLGCPYCKDPVPAPAVPELDPMTRLIVSDPKQLKPTALQAPAVPYGVDEEAANRIALAVYDCKNDICPEPLLYAINRILATEAHPLSVEGRDALLQSAPQAPAVPEEWRDVMQDAHDTFQRYADQHRAKDTRDSHEKANVNQKLANRLYALLQSAEVRHD